MKTNITSNIPDFITHYSRGEPFLSLSSVAKDNLQSVLNLLNESNAWGLNRFSDPVYLKQRILIEQKIRYQLITKGGKPELDHPVYFFLGRNARFEEHKKNIGYKINLKDIPLGAMSFTYGDSMFSLNDEYRKKLGGEYLTEQCCKVYGYNELDDLFSAINNRSDRLHIECQLWIKPTIFTKE